MNSQEYRNLQEAYLDVYENEQLDEMPYQIYGPNSGSPSDSERIRLGKPYKNRKTAQKKADNLDQEIGGYRHSVRKVDESIDIFNYMVEYLMTEGYADTNENALVIMTNMSEGWKDNILEARVDDSLSDEEKQDARNKRSGGQSDFTRRNLTKAGRGKSPKGLKPVETTPAMTSVRKFEMSLNQPRTSAGKRVRGEIEMNKAERGSSGRRGS